MKKENKKTFKKVLWGVSIIIILGIVILVSYSFGHSDGWNKSYDKCQEIQIHIASDVAEQYIQNCVDYMNSKYGNSPEDANYSEEAKYLAHRDICLEILSGER